MYQYNVTRKQRIYIISINAREKKEKLPFQTKNNSYKFSPNMTCAYREKQIRSHDTNKRGYNPSAVEFYC